MSQRKLPISGPMLQEKAHQFAKDLNNTEFRGSNGWLMSFHKRNNIAFYVKSGEKADVDIAVVEDSGKKLTKYITWIIIHAIYLTWMRQASFSIQLRTKLCI